VKTHKPLKLTIDEQRLILRQAISAQRDVIAFQLSPAFQKMQVSEGKTMPARSLTMRLISHYPGPALKLLAGLVTLIFGLRAAGTLASTVNLISTMRSSHLR
jgi:hypothetical protein